MNYGCGLAMCQATTGGCLHPSCPMRGAGMATMYYIVPGGCICPPTSEQTCQGPMCPRKKPQEIFARS
jgi:hypothetical protein